MKSLLTGVCALISLTAVFILFNSCSKKHEVEPPPVINPTVTPVPYSVLVYLITPSDKTINYDYYNAAKTAVQKLQDWFKTQTGDNKTFVLNPVVVDTLTGLHVSNWYNNNHGPDTSGDNYAYFNIKFELKEVLGSKFDTTQHTYFAFVSTSIPDETIPRGLAIAGSDILNTLNTSNTAMGVEAHALAHAFGLPEPTVPTANGIMSDGVSKWPNCIFTAVEKDSLNASPFFTVQ